MRVIDLKKYKSLPQNMQAKSSSKKMQVNDQKSANQLPKKCKSSTKEIQLAKNRTFCRIDFDRFIYSTLFI